MKKTPDKQPQGPSSETLSRREAIKRLAKVAVGAAGVAAGVAALPGKALASKFDNCMANCCGIGYADYEAYGDSYSNYYQNSYSSSSYYNAYMYYSHNDYYSNDFHPNEYFYGSYFAYTSANRVF